MRPSLLALPCLIALAAQAPAQSPKSVDWPGVGNDPGRTRYSPLDQINRDSVSKLKPAGVHRGYEGRATARL